MEPVGGLQPEDWQRVQEDSETMEYRELMREVIHARFKSPMSQVHLFLDRAREHINLSNVQGERRQELYDVLDGKIMPPK